MTATMTDGERVAISRTAVQSERTTARRRWPAPAMAGGLLLIVGAIGILVGQRPTTEVRPPPVPGVSTAQFPDVDTASDTYIPGHSSGWHVHPGLHSVVVLSGTLTVYDENCVRSEYGPGQTYLGGSTPHIARNEASAVVDVAITFVYRSTGEGHGTAALPPPGCELQ